MTTAGLVDKSLEDKVDSQQESNFELPNNSSIGNVMESTSEMEFSSDNKSSKKSDCNKIIKSQIGRENCQIDLDKIVNLSSASSYAMNEKFAMVNGCIDFSSNNNNDKN